MSDDKTKDCNINKLQLCFDCDSSHTPLWLLKKKLFKNCHCYWLMSLPFKASFNQVTDSILIHLTLYTLCIIYMVISKCFIGPNPNLRLFWGLIDASLACVNDLFGQLRPDPHGHSNAATVVRHFVRFVKIHSLHLLLQHFQTCRIH